MAEVLVIDDHAPTREEISSLISQQTEFEVVGQAVDGREGLQLAQQLKPDIIVLDVMMPGMNGIETAAAIRSIKPDACILALSNHASKQLAEAMLDAGARGYVLKDQAYEEIIQALRAVAEGKRYISAHLGRIE